MWTFKLPWRLFAVHWVAKIIGLLVHVEGRPLGSNRNIAPRLSSGIGGTGT